MNKCALAVKFSIWLVNRTPAAARQLSDWNRIIQFTLAGEKPFFLRISGGRIEQCTGETEDPNLMFTSSSDEFFNVMTGRTKFDQGFSSGKYTIKGSIRDAVKLMRAVEIASEWHPTLMTLLRVASKVVS